jgi:hypothetical protein
MPIAIIPVSSYNRILSSQICLFDELKDAVEYLECKWMEKTKQNAAGFYHSLYFNNWTITKWFKIRRIGGSISENKGITMKSIQPIYEEIREERIKNERNLS